MTSIVPLQPLTGREAWKQGTLVFLRVSLSMVLLVAAYFLIPTRNDSSQSDLPFLLIELGVYAVVVAIQVPAIVKAKYPVLRAVEALALVVVLYLLIFARVYLSNSIGVPASFSQSLDHITALYFTVTVFATVGFGDIVATTSAMKLLVTVQMLLNLAVLGLLIKLLTSAAQRGVQRKRPKHPDGKHVDQQHPDQQGGEPGAS